MRNSVGNKTKTAMEGVAIAQIFFFFLTALTGWWDRVFVGDLNSFSLILLVLFCYVLSVVKRGISSTIKNICTLCYLERIVYENSTA